ncbi:hypothetical protein FO519_007552 [Halicephalobus sp. NKZ332]|nr:hypothetical protein FO519_007552 [Halicephalobus sp. NKZ332]
MTLTEEQVVSFERTAFAINLAAGGLATILRTIQFCTKKKRTELSPSLSFFTCILQPFDYFVCIGSIIGCVEFLYKGTVTTPLFIVARTSQSFGGNIIRFGMLVICIDRILSTIFLQSYHRWSTRKFGFILVSITIGCSALTSSTPHIFGLQIYNNLVILTLFINFLTLVLLWILDKRNKKMKKLITEKYNLTTRYQVIENIRILLIVRPYIILMTCVTIMAPIANRLALVITGRLQASIALFYLFYNIYFIICSIIYFKTRFKMFSTVESAGLSGEVKDRKPVVVTVLGEKLPGTRTMDEHFIQLKVEWTNFMTKKQKI